MTTRNRKWNVVVVGGGGLQAKAMFEAAARGGLIDRWLALDRAWGDERRAAAENLGIETATADVLDGGGSIGAFACDARLIVNLAGPFFRTGTVVLDACIQNGCDYLDICDDADATLALLARQQQASAAGVRALVGMGSSPGVTNILVRTGLDALGAATEATVAWVVDVADVTRSAAQHVFHSFSLVEADGSRRPVPAWEDRALLEVEFPDPVGPRTLTELAHPEPVTLPRFLPIETVRNFGAIFPDDAFAVTWALARLGAAADEPIAVGGGELPLREVAAALYERYYEKREATPYMGGGMVVEVRNGDEALVFSSGWDDLTMEESTGTPAAAGIRLMLEGAVPDAGVLVPELLDAAAFFPALGQVSRNTGSLQVHRVDGNSKTTLRLRDLLHADRSRSTVGGSP